MAKAIVRGVKTFDVDIAQEFRELHRQNAEIREDMNKQNAELRQDLTKLNEAVRAEIQALKDSINAQNNLVERELGKLNSNMEKVLQTLANHELRIAALEKTNLISDTKVETTSNLVKFGWYAAKWILGAGIIIGTLFSSANLIKIMF